MWTSRASTFAHPGDGGSIVVGWLTRIVIGAAIFGVLGYDAVAIGQGRVNAADEADQIAQDAHDTWGNTHSVDKAFVTARDEAKANGDTIVKGGFTVEPKTGLITVTLSHSVNTVVVKRFGFSRGWATMTATGVAQDQT